MPSPTAGQACAKVVLAIVAILALTLVVVLIVLIVRSPEVRSRDPAVVNKLALGSAYVITTPGSGVAVQLDLARGALTTSDPAHAGTYSSLNVVQLVSVNPAVPGAEISYGDKVKVYFPQAGLWFSKDTAPQFLTPDSSKATPVTVGPAPPAPIWPAPFTGTPPQSGPVPVGWPLQLFVDTPDPSDPGFAVLSMKTLVQLIPAAVFGYAGFGGV